MEPALTNVAVHVASEREIAQAFELHRGRLLRLANARCNSRADAEDLVQLCFMRALEQRERLPTGRRLEAWLITAVQRAAVDLWRRKRTRSEAPAKALHAAASAVWPPQDLPSWSHISTEQVAAAMRACPPWMQQVFEMYYTHNLSCREIGQRLRISESTVATRLHRARANVRVCLEQTLSAASELADNAPREAERRHCESA
jgi:RNA polymerase sigma-70 factor (ECF subfamily)